MSRGPALLAAAAAAGAAAAATPPNIIFILADDLGWHDVGFSGSGIDTPHIDGLLANGVRLSHYYGQPVCTPSRTAITTGRFPIAYGMQSYVLDPTGVDYGLNLNETTLAQLLRDRGGYATAHIGKHHMGEAMWEQTPTFRGYDYFHGYYSGGQDYFTHAESGAIDFRIDDGPRCGANCSVVDWGSTGVYSAEVYGMAAADRIAKHAAAYPAGEKPLFMYLATQSVHSPAQVPAHYIPSPCPWTAKRCTFAGMIRALDAVVGNVTSALAAAGMADDTLLIFVADNGGPTPDDGGGDSIGSTNWPLRGGKHGVFEGGVRLTSVVSGPLVSPPPGVARGGNLTGLMHHVDWFPTLLEAAGVDYTPAPGFELHGSSAWGMLTRGEASPRSEVLLNIDPCFCETVGNANGTKSGNAALRSGDWKLIVGQAGPPWAWIGPNGTALPSSSLTDDALLAADGALAPEQWHASRREALERARRGGVDNACGTKLWPLNNMTTALYNIADDPWERNDVAADHPDIVAQLLARIEVWATTVQVSPYWASAGVDPASNPALHNNTWTPWLPSPPGGGAGSVDTQ